MAGITITQHAADRMRQRGISRNEVVRVLAFGEALTSRYPAVYVTRIPKAEKTGQTPATRHRSNVVVVYQKGDSSDEHRVLTVYRGLAAMRYSR